MSLVLSICVLCALSSLGGMNGRPVSSGAGGPSGAARPLRWALGGRSASKLAAIKADLDLNPQLVEEPAVVVADSDDQQSLQRMTAQARVVITTVGPFAQLGEPLVAACIKTGTDYVDSTGESAWVDAMIRKYEGQAERNGALLVSMGGFDSVPADVGAYLAAAWLRRERHTAARHLQGYMSTRGGGVSGGTIASVMYMLDSPAASSSSTPSPSHPYLLNPSALRYERARPQEKEQLLPSYDRTVGKWTVPFVMAIVNTRVARRSLALRRQLEPATDGFGSETSYNECMTVSSPLYAFVVWLGLVAMALLLATRPTRALLRRVLPSPGQGPSEEVRAKATFAHRVVGRGEDGSVVESVFAGGDGGYTDTAKMLAEIGLLMALERESLPLQQMVDKAGVQQQSQQKQEGITRVGGFFTPSVVGGDRLVERLRGAGLRLEAHEFKPVVRKH